ncbi:MAG TPA: T9SS type A sorting domain-containing protein [Bacteroidales bacterium]|nr:T9SS type A sorting domain-containing protein [Bacteroidales bacterium]
MKRRLMIIMLVCHVIISQSAFSQVWNREVADSSGISLGYYCSLALDPSNNPVIVHMDADFFDLRYLERINNEWVVEVIDEMEYTGVSCDLEIDGDDMPHICFQQGALTDPTSGLRYMTRSQEVWEKETPEKYFLLNYYNYSYCSIDLTSAGDPVIGYYSNAASCFSLAFRRNNEWIIKRSPYNVKPVKIRLKSDNTPVIMFRKDEGILFVSYEESSGQWDEHLIPVDMNYLGTQGSELDFVMDNNDNIHLVGTVRNLQDYTLTLKYIFYNWVNWTAHQICDGQQLCRIAIDKDGNPAILTSPDKLTLFRKNGTDWTSEIIDPNCSGFGYADMVFDLNNQPHIALQAKPSDFFGVTEKDHMVLYYTLLPGSPQISLSATEFNFGEVWTQSYREIPLYIRNDGPATLIIGGYEISNFFPLDVQGVHFPLYINPGDSALLNLKFYPTEEKEYSGNLRLVTNDPEQQLIDIPVSGEGVSSGSSGTLELKVKDVIVDFANIEINTYQPLEGVRAGVYQGTNLISGQQFTNQQGISVFAGLNPGSYSINLFKGAEPADEDIDCSRNVNITLGPGYNSLELTLADSLFHYQTWLSDTLKHIKETDDLLVPVLNYSGVMNSVDDQVDTWAADFDSQRLESIARFLLVESMVKDLFDEGYQLGDEMFKDFGELMAFVFYSNDFSSRIMELIISITKACFGEGGQEALQELIQMLAEEIIKKEVLERVTESVMLAGSEIGFPGDTILMEAWQRVWSEYSTGWNFQFGTEEWGNIILGVSNILKVPFIQKVYIDQLTAPNIDKGLNYARDNHYNDNFHAASINQMDYVSAETNTVQTSLSVARFFRNNAELFMKTAAILGWLDAMSVIPQPISDFIDQVQFAMKIAAYFEVITALGISTGTFFVVPDNMENTVDEIYFPDGKSNKSGVKIQPRQFFKTARADLQQVDLLKQSISSKGSGYSEMLLDIKEKIITGNKLDALSDMLLLRTAELEHNNNILQALSPVMAVSSLAGEEIESFKPMFDSLKSWHAAAGEERYKTYFNLLLAVSDSTHGSDALISDLIDQNLEADRVLTGHIADLLDTVTVNMNIPPVLIATVTPSLTKSLALNETGTVRFRITNTGALPAENINLKISFSEALSLEGSDNIFIGSLAAGEVTDEMELKFICSDDNFEIGIWNIKINSENSRVTPCMGTFSIGEVITSIRPSPEADEIHFSVFPNPLIKTGYIGYNINQTARIKISLYDLFGRRLSTLSEVVQAPGTYRQSVNLSHYSPGLYIITMEINGLTVAKKKIILSGMN